tara:strand:- start:2257 stop:3222 length:966 start_codon:yes stop_codon:yes gene_type:complete
MEPVPQIYIDQLHEAKGNIKATLHVLNNVEREQYIPLDDLLDTVRNMSAAMPQKIRDRVNGFLFGSGSIHMRPDKERVGYQKYTSRLAEDEFRLVSIAHTDAHRFIELGSNIDDEHEFGFMSHLRKTLIATDHPLTAKEIMHGYQGDNGKRVPGVWDDVSQRYADNAFGHIVTVTPHSDPNRVFVQSELPALIQSILESDDIKTINGLDAALFADSYLALKSAHVPEDEIYQTIDQVIIQPSSIEIMRRYDNEFTCDLGVVAKHAFSVAIMEEFAETLQSALPLQEMRPTPLEELDCGQYNNQTSPDQQGGHPQTIEALYH